MDSPRILVIDDEPAMLENCRRLLTREGYACTTLAEPLRFRTVAEELRPDVVLTDLRMPGADGMTLLAASLADEPTRPVLMMTAHASVASAISAIREGAFDYVTKPFTGEQLVVAVERAVRYRALRVENAELREEVARRAQSPLLGASPVMTRLLEQVRRVAPTDANVLVTGESGTGKELVARELHQHSQRRDAPFIPVDCAALPEGLLESELFGHEKGAFTGAEQRKDGLLVQGNGGTIFLDELGELSITLQSKLLRALEQRQVRRLGDWRLIDLDIRVIAATNRDLEEEVAAGRFREDLYYRLNVVSFVLPPLRARPGDLQLLLRTFLNEFSLGLQRPVPAVTADAWAVLEQYAWPGNVRELRNLAQRIVVLDDDGRITLADLPDRMRSDVRHRDRTSSRGVPSYERAQEEAMAEFRERYLRTLLEQHGGNISQAARAAGVSRRTLHRWLADGQPVERT